MRIVKAVYQWDTVTVDCEEGPTVEVCLWISRIQVHGEATSSPPI